MPPIPRSSGLSHPFARVLLPNSLRSPSPDSWLLYLLTPFRGGSAALHLFRALAFALIVGNSIVSAAGPQPIPLWPGKAPGETADLPPEADLSRPIDNVGGRPIIRLSNVSTPTITVYPPPLSQYTGAAVVVCPGGGYSILAYDLEGTEVCEWLNSIGVTAVLLKYRVPARPGLARYAPALQDAQRALGLVRAQALTLKIDPKRVGILGFSAGGHLSALLSSGDGARTYPHVDAADDLNCKPDFCILVYPGGVVQKERLDLLSPEIQVTAQTPPTFLAMAEDDPVHVENALVYYSALQRAKVPAEMHLYPKGGHGYGKRLTTDIVTTWPDRATDWMKASGWLKAAK